MDEYAMQNRRWVLASRPNGLVTADTMRLETVEVAPLQRGYARARVCHLSIDPTIRTWMDDAPGYLPPIGIGDTVRSLGVAEITESLTDAWDVGDVLFGPVGWQEVVLISEDNSGFSRLPVCESLVKAVDVFGPSGLAAYLGMIEVGRVREGDTVVVSAAAGATGSLAGQIARIKGAARVVGIAGGLQKCEAAMARYGFDAMVDYKSGDLRRELLAACPSGIDLYFDNVGGATLDAAVAALAKHGRVVLCGAIASYNASAGSKGQGVDSWELIFRRARMEGFVILDFADRFDAAREQLADWLNDGRLVSDEHVLEGLEAAPDALNRLFSGGHSGKLVVTLRA